VKPRLAVLASGRGSNFQSIQKAIAAGTLDAEIVVLISDRKKAPALEIATDCDIEAQHIAYDKENRQAFEMQAAALIEAKNCDLIILAGFMRIITPWLIDRFAGKMLNIHPSLLPSFKGLHPQQQALDAGVKIAGCTVHIVTEEMDSGPIIAQRAVDVLDDDDEDTLSERILVQEHLLYPEAIAIYSKQL
jgi:phosphoribosylglycinamide formyltransferase-1